MDSSYQRSTSGTALKLPNIVAFHRKQRVQRWVRKQRVGDGGESFARTFFQYSRSLRPNGPLHRKGTFLRYPSDAMNRSITSSMFVAPSSSYILPASSVTTTRDETMKRLRELTIKQRHPNHSYEQLRQNKSQWGLAVLKAVLLGDVTTLDRQLSDPSVPAKHARVVKFVEYECSDDDSVLSDKTNSSAKSSSSHGVYGNQVLSPCPEHAERNFVKKGIYNKLSTHRQFEKRFALYLQSSDYFFSLGEEHSFGLFINLKDSLLHIVLRNRHIPNHRLLASCILKNGCNYSSRNSKSERPQDIFHLMSNVPIGASLGP